MTHAGRPSLLYVVPGSDFLPSAGPTRNVLNLVRSMDAWADVTLAFRRVVEAPEPADPPVVEIAASRGPRAPVVDDAATRGMSYAGFVAYLREIRRFLAARATSVDLVLEKDWMLTGYVSRTCRRRGTPSVPVKNWVAGPRSGAANGPFKATRHAVSAGVEGWLLRGAPCVVAETAFLKRAMVETWRLDPQRVHVIGLGVDRTLFRPGDPAEARAGLGIAPDATVLLYAGILDRTHDLEPLLRTVGGPGASPIELHLVGDGPRRTWYEGLAQRSSRVVFHGRVPHGEVPRYLAAADLCVAPYDISAFHGGEVGYSTLKVREYLSAGRAVATVPSGSLRALVVDGVSGFLLDNDVDRWRALLAGLPSRARLAEMGRSAAATDLETWGDVSRSFQRLCSRELASSPGRSGSTGDVAPCEVPGG